MASADRSSQSPTLISTKGSVKMTDQKRNGYGRQIYVDGNYYVGHWKDNMKNGWGKKVYVKTGKVEEGLWENGEFKS